MPTFKVAHVREQGVDLIIIPLERAFGQQPDHEQERETDVLQAAAASAGLAGVVVPVWVDSSGRFNWRAPRNYHPFFESISMMQVQRSLNRTISW